MLQGRLNAAVEQRIAEGAAAAQDLSSAHCELDAARAAASEASAAVAELRGGLEAARAREQEQQRLLSEMQVRDFAADRMVCELHLSGHACRAYASRQCSTPGVKKFSPGVSQVSESTLDDHTKLLI